MAYQNFIIFGWHDKMKYLYLFFLDDKFTSHTASWLKEKVSYLIHVEPNGKKMGKHSHCEKTPMIELSLKIAYSISAV